MSHPYAALSPELILDAVESCGFEVNGALFNLNSYENRVIQVMRDEQPPLIAKFYRPGRWPDAAIREEHAFSLALADADIPVIAPLQIASETLFEYQGFRFALYPRAGGRPPELDNIGNLQWLGRMLGRMHLMGSTETFEHRPTLDSNAFGHQPAQWLLSSGLLPAHLEKAYADTSNSLLELIDASFEKQPVMLRIHADCHRGNILWTDQGPHFVDLDDCRNGPAVQDLWMLLSGDRDEAAPQLDALLDGYEMFRHFDDREISLIEPLRSLRLMHYAAWLARRWQDPAFPPAFPWFGSNAYWEEHIRMLEDQINLMAI